MAEESIKLFIFWFEQAAILLTLLAYHKDFLKKIFFQARDLGLQFFRNTYSLMVPILDGLIAGFSLWIRLFSFRELEKDDGDDNDDSSSIASYNEESELLQLTRELNRVREEYERRLEIMQIENNILAKYYDNKKWEDEKKELTAKLNSAIEASKHDKAKLEEQRNDWVEEKKALVAKLDKKQSDWDKEKEKLLEKLKTSESWYNYYYNLSLYHGERNRQWDAEKRELNSQLYSANQWRGYYQSCAEYSEDELAKLNEQYDKDLAEKLDKEARLARDLDEKVKVLKKEKGDLIAKLSTATACSEVYRSFLHN